MERTVYNTDDRVGVDSTIKKLPYQKLLAVRVGHQEFLIKIPSPYRYDKSFQWGSKYARGLVVLDKVQIQIQIQIKFIVIL